jgi:hypothetical protein
MDGFDGTDRHVLIGWLRWGLIAVAVVAGCLAVASLAFWSSGVQGWLAGLFAAILSGIGVDLALATGRRMSARRAAAAPPVAVTVAVRRAHYFTVASPTGPVMVPCSGFTLRITVEGRPDRSVILTGLRPIVLSRQTPSGVLSPHAGIAPVRPFVLLLDPDPPLLAPQPGSTADFPFTVSQHDPEIFEIEVRTDRWDVTYRFELDWVCAGRTGSTPVNLAGHPFRTIARPPGRSLEW